MTAKHLYRAMSGIDPQFILEAAPAESAAKPKAGRRTNRAAMAACLCVAFVGAILFYTAGQTSPAEEQTSACYALNVSYQGAVYEVVSEAETLERCGLPTELTSELAGELLGYLEEDGDKDGGYHLSEGVTENAIYEYAPQPNDDVYLLLLDGEYCAAIRFDEDGYHGLS